MSSMTYKKKPYYLKHQLFAQTHNKDDTSYPVMKTLASVLTNDADKATATWLFEKASKCPTF